ncbi:hypothetical protein Rumeso_04993 [Rubellimicrobium mesophilum DSM 19309]|uniref:Uncharacterized protein n=1 Tax=Rubellimicrobium mesophilum DSM 19309 TaxID=442562 RepID=A0A017HAU2_9RHOB|nr:hypothetical protein [Rubellimicrobium mesophilum]EYD71592.1 hypothetical protein Rumeso_04993 [Rubellimicrobium mesophilum DSM 19309]
MATDNFQSFVKGLDSVADTHRVITPGTGVLDPKPRALFFNGTSAGTITVEDGLGTSIVYNCQPGQVLPFRGTKVTAATATVVGWE